MARNLITDVAGLKVGHADDATLASGVDRDRVRRARGRRRRRARRRAGHARDRPARRRTARSSASTPSCCPAARRSGSTPPPACRPGCASRAAALRSATPRADRAAARSCSTCSTAATRTGAASRPIASLAMRRPRPPALDFALGSAGAGFGATTVNLKGGLGSASAVTRDGLTVGALVAVNACGSVTVGDGRHFWAAPFEQNARIRRPRLSGRTCRPEALRSARQGPARREHHHRAGRDRRRARPRRRPSSSR